jgi:hypothetical protein
MFMLSVVVFGGGGFVSIIIDLHGIVGVEAALEFGGNFSMDIGVASGGVYVQAGVYFAWLKDGDNTTSPPTPAGVTLTGFIRMGGSLSVLDLITLSMEFYMSFTYQSAGNQVWGQASLTVEISILFFSIGVTLTVTKQFAGSSSSASLDGVELAAGLGGPRSDSGGLLRGGPRQYKTQDLMTAADWKAYCDAFA